MKPGTIKDRLKIIKNLWSTHQVRVECTICKTRKTIQESALYNKRNKHFTCGSIKCRRVAGVYDNGRYGIPGKRTNILGKKFGGMVAVDLLEDDESSICRANAKYPIGYKVRAKCIWCKRYRRVWAHHLKAGRYLSCGCRKHGKE